MWLLALLLTPARAEGPTAICADVQARLRDPNTGAEEVAATLRKDDRAYTTATLGCLCAIGAPPEVHREARRHLLRDSVPVDAAVWPLATDDPLTSPAFQLSVLLARRLETQAGRGVPFVVLPTRLDPPGWLDVSAAFATFREFEVPGTRLPPSDWLADQGIDALPAGPLSALDDGGALAAADLSGLLGTYDRALWFDLSRTDGVPRLSWSLVGLSARRPYLPLSRDGVTLDPVSAPMVPDCLQPPRREVRLWRTRLAWPGGRIATTVTGAVLGAVFGGLALMEHQAFQAAAPGDPGNQGRIDRNIAYGTIGIVGGATAVIGASVPGSAWR